MKAAQVRPEIIRAETVITTEASMDQAEPSSNITGTGFELFYFNDCSH